MKIILIDPGRGESSFNSFGKSHFTSIIHQGLCGLYTCAEEAGFNDINLLDIRQIRGWKHFDVLIKTLKPNIAGLTMRSCDAAFVPKMARRIKRLVPECRTVIGGVHVSIAGEELAQVPEFDYLIAGDGEITFIDFLKAMEKGKTWPAFCWGERPELDKLPFIKREIYPYETTITLPNYEGAFHPPMVTIVGSRGCFWKCTFCAPHARTHWGRGVRSRSPENIVGELKILHDKYRFNTIKFYDYNFTADREWSLQFCKEYRKSGIQARFFCQTRADLIVKQEDLLQKLKDVGLRMVMVGFESGSDRVLTMLKKGTTREINLEAGRILKNLGLLISGSFMLGTPHETKEDVDLTVSLVREMKPNFTSVSFFTPIPGNHLYDYCIQNNLSLIKDPDELYTFSPEKPKIKGVDYDYLRKATAKIMGARFGGAITGKLIAFFYTKTKKYHRFRRLLVFLYSWWVSSKVYELILARRTSTEHS
jgi:radical SAM superfamily enzyme YgiQ (UPF0313 family)